MVSDGAYTFAVIAALLLIVSGAWAQFRFRKFARLPAHFDIHGRPTRFAGRNFTIWLTPVILITLIAVMLWLAALPGQPGINGDPDSAIYIASAMMLGAQALILWLTERWARGQE